EAEALFAACARALIGAGAGLGLTSAMLLGAAPLCPLCPAVHATSLALVFTLQAAIARPLAEQLRMARASVAEWLGPSAGTPGSARWPLVGFCCAAMVAVVVFQWVYVESGLLRPHEPGAPDPAKVIASYESSPRVALPASPTAPHRRPLTAPVQHVAIAR